MRWAVEAAERGWVPDLLVRAGIRRLLTARRREIAADDPATVRAAREELLEEMASAPIAVAAERANEQHYELPARFFETVLGPRLKYSCAWFPAGGGAHRLARAEEEMLELSCRRAGLEDGMEVLDLGCGWGSLALWIAQTRPACHVLAVSNSRDQRRFIEGRRDGLGLDNLEVVTADMNRFDPGPRRFHRAVSVEMFEHMRNWGELFRRVASWLEPDGRLFLHVFCHREAPYLFEDRGSGDWMARHFFTGGLMPSFDLPRRFPAHLELEESWAVSGDHYRHTLLAWLERLDGRRREVLEILAATYGEAEAERWLQRWRLFFLACAELFGYRDGDEWLVGHYRLRPAVRGREETP